MKIEMITEELLASFAASSSPNREDSTLPTWEKWSNTDGKPKTILFDADLSNAKISMMNRAYSVEEVKAQVAALPSPVKEMTYALMWCYPWQ